MQLAPDLRNPAAAEKEGCEAFVHIGGDYIYCTIDQLREALDNPPTNLDEEDLSIVEVDHKYPSHVWNLLSIPVPDRNMSNVQPLVAVLYGSLASRKTLELHQFLKSV